MEARWGMFILFIHHFLTFSSRYSKYCIHFPDWVDLEVWVLDLILLQVDLLTLYELFLLSRDHFPALSDYEVKWIILDVSIMSTIFVFLCVGMRRSGYINLKLEVWGWKRRDIKSVIPVAGVRPLVVKALNESILFCQSLTTKTKSQCWHERMLSESFFFITMRREVVLMVVGVRGWLRWWEE